MNQGQLLLKRELLKKLRKLKDRENKNNKKTYSTFHTAVYAKKRNPKKILVPEFRCQFGTSIRLPPMSVENDFGMSVTNSRKGCMTMVKVKNSKRGFPAMIITVVVSMVRNGMHELCIVK